MNNRAGANRPKGIRKTKMKSIKRNGFEVKRARR